MRIAGLFAGVGGLELGLRQAGHETVVFSEVWEPSGDGPRASVRRYPQRRRHRESEIAPEKIDLVTAGFPCQDLSQAGKTAGIKGQKSGLVAHVFRLIDRDRPKWVLLENVSFMLRLDGGSAMARLVSEFEERGYRWAYRVVNSLSFLPHRRERVFFLASTEGDPADVLLVDEVTPFAIDTMLHTHAHGFYWTEGTRGLGWGRDCVPTLKNGSTVGIPSPPAILLTNGEIVTPDIRDAERLQGLPPDWTKPAGSVARASLRWSLIGNAVTKPVATWIGRRLLAPKNTTAPGMPRRSFAAIGLGPLGSTVPSGARFAFPNFRIGGSVSRSRSSSDTRRLSFRSERRQGSFHGSRKAPCDLCPASRNAFVVTSTMSVLWTDS